MALTGAPVMGVKCKMYVKDTTYQECGIVNDTVSASLSRDEAELKERGNLETLTDVGHKVREISTTITTRYGNTLHDLLAAAAESGATVEIALTNGFAPSNADARGNAGGYKVTQFNREEPIQGFAAASITLKPSIDGPAIAALPLA
ncbi:hypothetical protein Pan44_26700 [Caulifigura coniformis]|uniref:Phage late control gene D protein (GPD) n=1 Tax=Caulifigura coniformis TaxID=2527983 RepID=A0A517SET0_9PLAN|nr:hypothetical protein [Caulifigura coniformis]QDT54635.1 hypothetical protein Pan44_26700 [Caulifigura coniformis]